MKKSASAFTSFLGLTAVSVVVATPLTGPGNFEVFWYTIDGGGGTSTGGSFSISGTIGQPDAGTLAGGSFELSGGFWAGGVIQNCPADLASGDGLINVFDLFVLLSNWNTAGPGADLAPPTIVADVFDLFVLLGAWGACD